jgi:hypothetical protein
MSGKFGTLTCSFIVELPGIEPGPKISSTCRNSGIDDAKQRETTCGHANGVDGINTSSTPGPCFTLPSSCPYQRRCADGYRGDSLSLDVIDEWGLSVRGLDGLARVSATR